MRGLLHLLSTKTTPTKHLYSAHPLAAWRHTNAQQDHTSVPSMSTTPEGRDRDSRFIVQWPPSPSIGAAQAPLRRCPKTP